MKHIKEFDGYSDDDLNDLIGDLEGIGHKHQLKFGKDFGFSPLMKDSPVTGTSTLYFTQDAANFLEDTGYLVSDRNSTNFFGPFEYKISKENLPEMRGPYGNLKIQAGLKKHEKSNPNSLLRLDLFSGNKKFPETYYGAKFRMATVVNAINKILTDIKSIRK